MFHCLIEALGFHFHSLPPRPLPSSVECSFAGQGSYRHRDDIDGFQLLYSLPFYIMRSTGHRRPVMGCHCQVLITFRFVIYFTVSLITILVIISRSSRLECADLRAAIVTWGSQGRHGQRRFISPLPLAPPEEHSARFAEWLLGRGYAFQAAARLIYFIYAPDISGCLSFSADFIMPHSPEIARQFRR